MNYIALNTPYTPQAIVYNTVTTFTGGVIVGVHDTSCTVHPYAVSGGSTMVVGVGADGTRTSLKTTGTGSETGSVSITAGQYEWLEIKVGSSIGSINSSGQGRFKFDS